MVWPHCVAALSGHSDTGWSFGRHCSMTSMRSPGALRQWNPAHEPVASFTGSGCTVQVPAGESLWAGRPAAADQIRSQTRGLGACQFFEPFRHRYFRDPAVNGIRVCSRPVGIPDTSCSEMFGKARTGSPERDLRVRFRAAKLLPAQQSGCSLLKQEKCHDSRTRRGPEGAPKPACCPIQDAPRGSGVRKGLPATPSAGRSRSPAR